MKAIYDWLLYSHSFLLLTVSSPAVCAWAASLRFRSVFEEDLVLTFERLLDFLLSISIHDTCS